MLVDAILIVVLEDCDDDRRKSFAAAMSRRGWWKLRGAEEGFRIGFRDAADDDEIVQISERDVWESAYVAGVKSYEATCLIIPDDSGTDGESERNDPGGCLDPGDQMG